MKYIIGIDEAGRGPLAGPLTVAAVASPANHKFHPPRRTNSKFFRGVKDSKKLSPRKREEWNEKIQNAKRKSQNNNSKFKIFLAISSISNQIIDKIGITKATALAIKKVIGNLKIKTDIKPQNAYFLLDGLLKAPEEFSQKTIIKGDEKAPIISAASIIAKVARDRKMKRLHKKFPDYGFARHKGYGTKAHREAIKQYGFCDIHRKSFCKNIIFKL